MLDNICLSENDIKTRRKFVKEEWQEKYGKDESLTITEDSLNNLFYMYDTYFFFGSITQELSSKNSDLILKTTKGKPGQQLAGWCKRQRKNDRIIYTINIPMNLYMNLKICKTNPRKNSGISCNNIFKYLQITFEHELIHLIVFLSIEEKVKPHGKEFKLFVTNYFGHSKYDHELSDNQIDLKVGDNVSSIKNGKDVFGVVERVLRINIEVRLRDGSLLRGSPSLCKKIDAPVEAIIHQKYYPKENDRVKFTYKDEEMKGTIIKLLKVNVVIKLDNGMILKGNPSVLEKI